MSWRGTLATIAFLSWSGTVPALDRVVLEVGEISVGAARVSGAQVELDLTTGAPIVAVRARRVAMTGPAGVAFDNVSVACGQVVIHEPEFACREARLSALGGPAKSIAMRGSAAYDTVAGTLDFAGTGLAVAGGHVQFTGRMAPANWALRGRAEALSLSQIRRLAKPWVSLPDSYALEGRLAVDAGVSGRPGALRLQVGARTGDLDFTNEAGTVVAEKVALQLRATARQSPRGLEIETQLDGTAGQALAGPVLLDFGKNPLKIDARGRSDGAALELGEIAITQRDLLAADARASLRLDAAPFVTRAHADITSVQFPAAYDSFVRIALAATDFGTLEAAGSARGAVEIANDALTRLDVQIDDLDLEDEKTQFMMADLRGDLHWSPDAAAVVEPSSLAWSRMRAYGLSGGTARLDFRTRGRGFELTQEARVPIFDGAVIVHSLGVRDLGADGGGIELGFDADIEPISMALIAKAFEWPQLAGQLSGRIPGLTFRNNVLALNGDLTASVFDGTITGRNFRLQDPLGPWPRMFADVTARGLDLETLTGTFSIGSITGRLDADLAHLELFNWSPVSFDARLYSTPKDRSKHLISQKAVTSISSIGGGSGGVTKALQSGVLRFFEQFRYDRIGIECRLRNEVCLMSGVEPHGDGYYLVKGKGLPRIDIIGNQGRVDWPQLLTQIEAAMAAKTEDVRVQ